VALPVVLRGAVCAAPDRGRRGLRAQVRKVDHLTCRCSALVSGRLVADGSC
jgi:hypothetical protein